MANLGPTCRAWRIRYEWWSLKGRSQREVDVGAPQANVLPSKFKKKIAGSTLGRICPPEKVDEETKAVDVTAAQLAAQLPGRLAAGLTIQLHAS